MTPLPSPRQTPETGPGASRPVDPAWPGPRVLAFIPARGGSKGLPRKNILPLAGKPLVAYSIEAALAAALVDRVVVSTDDEEIAAVAAAYGADIPLRRPAELAQDHSSIDEAVRHCRASLAEQGYVPDVFAVLLPSSPFRPAGLVDFLVGKALEGRSPVRTVRPMAVGPLTHFVRGRGRRLAPLLGPEAPAWGAAPHYRSYGLFGSDNSGPGHSPYFHPITDPAALIDIDYPSDFRLAEAVLQSGLFDFSARGAP